MNLPVISNSAQAALERILRAEGNQRASLSRALRPSLTDYRYIFKEEIAEAFYQAYENHLWQSPDQYSLRPSSPEQTQVVTFASSTGRMRESEAERFNFPGGYEQVLPYWSDFDVPIFAFKFVTPGNSTGMSYDGLYAMGDSATGAFRFVWIPKPWRLLP